MYITKIVINDVLNLPKQEIDLGETKKHLIITGNNGVGKITFDDTNTRIHLRRSDGSYSPEPTTLGDPENKE